MATYGGANYTNFKGVNFKNTAFIRVEAGAYAHTLSFKASPDASRAIVFPDKSGNIGITGTFTVNLPAIAAAKTGATNVTVSGVRAEDAMVCAIQKTFTTTTLSDHANNGVGVLIGCKTGNGGVNLTFVNPTATTTIYEDLILAYTIVR